MEGSLRLRTGAVFRAGAPCRERLQIDWVDCRELGVRIGGEAFCHKLVHVVLPFSNWEWARVCRSESFLSLKIGLQSAAWELGGVPQICRATTADGDARAWARPAGPGV